MAAADGPELDRGHAGLQKRDRVRRAVAPDRQRLALDRFGDRVAQRANVRIGPRHVRGRALEGLDDPHVSQPADVREDRAGILVGEKANVDVHAAEVRHLVERVAAVDPRDVDRGPVEEIGGLATEG